MPVGVSIARTVPRFNPAWLPNLEGWWSALDPNQVTASAAGLASQVNDLSGRGRHLLQATGARQPTFLPWAGRNYLYLPHVIGNNASTPSAPANRITGSIDLRVSAHLTMWQSADTSAILIAKDGNAGQLSYLFWLETDAKLYFRYSPDGTAVRTATSSVVVPFADNTPGWVRATYNSATGDVIFHTSSDGASWTQLGSTQSVTAGAIFDGTDGLYIGMQSDGVSSLGTKGRIYRAEVRNGIGGSIAALFDPSEAPNSASSFKSSTGETWTVNVSGNSRIAQIVGCGGLMLDPSGIYMQTATFPLGAVTTVYIVGKPNTWVDDTYIIDGFNSDSMVIYSLAPSPRVEMFAAGSSAQVTVLDTWLPRIPSVVTAVFNGANSKFRYNRNTAVSGSVVAGGNPAGFTLGGHAGSDRFCNVQFNEILIFSVAHDAATQDKVIRFLADRVKIAV